jgi:hypothetical protein
MAVPASCLALIAAHKPLERDACIPTAIPEFDLIEVICIGIFTVDYLARILTVHSVTPAEAGIDTSSGTKQKDTKRAPQVEDEPSNGNTTDHKLRELSTPEEEEVPSCVGQTLRYAAQPFNIIDIAAIAPFYLEMVTGNSSGGTQVLRVLRLLRVFRILRMPKYSSGLVMFQKVR